MRRYSNSTLFALITLVVTMFAFNGCWEEQHPGTYYTFTGQTVASDLAAKPEYSDFVRILQRSGMWNNLRTYGYNTCFAPDNNAIAQFIKERETFYRNQGKDVTFNTVEDLPKEDCDTLSWTHLLDITCYLGDLNPGILPKVNLNDRYLILTLDSTKVEQLGDSVIALQRRLNNAIVIEKDDSCENGVVHFIDRCIDFGGNFVYDLVDNDPNTQLFSQAIKECGFHPILSEWYDDTYTMGDDSVRGELTMTQAGSTWTLHYWEKRKTCFTLLVPTDETFAKNGVHTLDDMFNLANSIYNPNNDLDDAILADYKNPKNPLFQFMSYHILPFMMNLSRINGRKEVVKTHNAGITTPEDYFETYLPRSIMRITTLYNDNGDMDMGKVFINNRGTEGNGTTKFNGAKVRGIKILTHDEMFEKYGISKYDALNGVYHYVDGILKYDSFVREDVLDRRMRIDCTTLSPDFITSGARQCQESEVSGSIRGSQNSTAFKNPKNFASYDQNYRMQVRPTKADGAYAYEGDGIDIQGQFDMYVKLPAVPHDGTWQLRLSYRGNSKCGIIQTYYAAMPVGVDPDRTSWKPLGIPVDLRFSNLSDTPNVGWVSDSDLDGDEAIEEFDKSMKNRGWLKGSIAQTTNSGTPHRETRSMGRMIIMTDYLTSGIDYYLRIKQILDGKDGEFLFDFIEWVPKSVYDNGEDKN